MIKANKIISIVTLLFLILLLTSCYTDSLKGEDNFYGEGIRIPKTPSLDTTNTKINYIEAYDLESIPKETDFDNFYLTERSYPGNLAPFPTKSLQPYQKLKELGIIDSEQANLKDFYLLSGPLTQINSVVETNSNYINYGEDTLTTIKNIIHWEHTYLTKCTPEELKNYSTKKRERTAEEVILSKCATGCTDYVTVFVALARAKGIPSTVTETIKVDWIKSSIKSKNLNNIEGHFFSEVYLPDKKAWVVVDPTSRVISGRDENGYYLRDNYSYVLIERGLDYHDYGIRTLEDLRKELIKRYYIS